ncbi:MAG: BFD domain protein (2Fe-2S)-binding domain protein [Methylococcaceae bacterium NSP1-2]|nr:(2Fe-2S)-binding protein [Methylococcaceae bacterium]OYV18016.1 MAG: BFD domain protein (2Fe-2S)-binding domain protein [Methylococcaceae bacterium NSP1-2]
MNNSHPNKQQEFICHCSRTTRAKIEALIANEVNTIEEIANATGAMTGCGACEDLVVELIAQGE